MYPAYPAVFRRVLEEGRRGERTGRRRLEWNGTEDIWTDHGLSSSRLVGGCGRLPSGFLQLFPLGRRVSRTGEEELQKITDRAAGVEEISLFARHRARCPSVHVTAKRRCFIRLCLSLTSVECFPIVLSKRIAFNGTSLLLWLIVFMTGYRMSPQVPNVERRAFVVFWVVVCMSSSGPCGIRSVISVGKPLEKRAFSV